MGQWKGRGFEDSRGRERLSDEIVKAVFDTWVDNSISSTDGSNMRNMVNIDKCKIYEIYHNLFVLQHEDIKIEERKNKCN